MSTKLTIDDIADQRAYERQRAEFRSSIIELKKLRRVSVGPIVTFVFESRDTIRFQIQEMARAERLATDEAIQIELDTYNPLIPSPGELSCTMFIEMVTDEEQRHWKPLLVGILDAIYLRIGTGDDMITVKAEIEESHAEMLTREIPPSVNYVRFVLDPSGPGFGSATATDIADIVAAFAAGPVALAVDHPNYTETAVLSSDTVAELINDLQP